ncbi:histone-lysine N-methyltransferase 2B [Pelobates cultripes]|uniref:[histone H3]-lysine(4) N-methyltransferase n=1 Tax=Pelobates cultripes TaxID=61616 RepID=A0AAD1WPY0_PELCU|nr:histone-lysine N-methyltransferase 2B [Pelobates cultripes]
MAAAASSVPAASGRGRFPGRPWVGRIGNRADRARVPFGSEGAADSPDPAQLQILGLHENMKRLAGACGRDCGDSDSTEEEFKGFNAEEQNEGQSPRLTLRSKKGQNPLPVTDLSPPKQERLAVHIPKHIFTPERVVRVHLTPLDPTLYGLEKSLFFHSPSEKQDTSRKPSSPLSSSPTLPSDKEQLCQNGLSAPPEQKPCSVEPPKNKRRCSGSKRTTCESKISSLDCSVVIKQKEIHCPVEVLANESGSSLKVVLLRKTKAREDEANENISQKDLSTSKTEERDKAVPPPNPPQDNDVLKTTRRSRKAKASDLGSVLETVVLAKPNETLPTINKEGKRASQVPKVKWKLRAGYRQVSELETVVHSWEEKTSKEDLSHEKEENVDSNPPLPCEPPSSVLEEKLNAKENLVHDVKDSLRSDVGSSKRKKKLRKKGRNAKEYSKDETSELTEHHSVEEFKPTEDHQEDSCERTADNQEDSCERTADNQEDSCERTADNQEDSCQRTADNQEDSCQRTADNQEDSCQRTADNQEDSCQRTADNQEDSCQRTADNQEDSCQPTEHSREYSCQLNDDQNYLCQLTENLQEASCQPIQDQVEACPLAEDHREEECSPAEDHRVEACWPAEVHQENACDLVDGSLFGAVKLRVPLSSPEVTNSQLVVEETDSHATEIHSLPDQEPKESDIALSKTNDFPTLTDCSSATLNKIRALRKKKPAQITRSQKAERTAAQRLLAKVKEAQSRAQPQLEVQSSKKIATRSSTVLKSIGELVLPLTRVRSSRVIKTPRRFIDEQSSVPVSGPLGKSAPSDENVELGDKSMTELEQETLSDTIPALSDSCFNLFDEEEQFALLPTLSPRSESTRSTSTASSAASSPSLHPFPSTDENKRKNILRAPTFCWNSSAPELQPSPCPAKPLFRLSSPGSPDEILPPTSPTSPPPSPLPSQSIPKLESAKRSPLLRAPQFTPSEAHLKIYQSVSLQDCENPALQAFSNRTQQTDLNTSLLPVVSAPELSLTPTKQSDMQPGGRRANHLALPLFVDPTSEKLDDQSDSDSALAMAESLPDFLGESEMLREPMEILNYASESHADALLPTVALDAIDKPETLEIPLPLESIKLEPVDRPGVVCKVAIRQSSPSPVESIPKSTSAINEPLLYGTDKKVINLLEKAKLQLIKIDKQKSADLKDVPDSPDYTPHNTNKTSGSFGQGQDSPLQGPRIKHVCRHPAVALGQPRAVIPEDIPRLSALPLREREATISSIAPVEDSSSASEPESPSVRTNTVCSFTKASIRRPKTIQRGRLRMARCGECKGCLVTTDCGKCVNCLDKTKFGGPNTKKQCCVYRRCDLIEARRQERLQKKGRKGIRTPAPPRDSPIESDDTFPETEVPDLVQDTQSLQRKSSRRCVRQRPCYDLFPDSEDSDYEPSPSATRRKSRRESDLLPQEPEEPSKPRKNPQQPMILRARRGYEQEPTLPGVSAKLKSVDGTHRLRVDFKEDCDLQNVWLMGGLSILTSFPVKPPLVCLLCASRGQHQFLFCQVCCEPFHYFCLEENERPRPEQEGSWCCRRCKFCNVCGRKGKTKKPLLECELCQTNYHVNCLGPNYPVKPPLSRESWMCSACVRCKSCGASPAVEGDVGLSDGYNLCVECSTLYEKGHFCPICSRCYDENDFESKMVQCVKCDKWVHSKCEGLSDEGYELLSNLPDSVVYTCPPCLGGSGAIWKEAMLSELTAGLHEVLQGLFTSKFSDPLLKCKQCSTDNKCPRNPCDLKSLAQILEEGNYSSICNFNDDLAWIIQNKVKQENSDSDCDGDAIKGLYLKLMEKCFSWFHVEESIFWEQSNKSVTKGILSNAVMPPSSDHTYANWQQKADGLPVANRISPQTESSPKVKKDVEEELDRKTKCREDNRQCALCLKYGDDEPKDAGRLLYIGQNEWTHINCAIWSAEVFEEDDGSLKNVHAAVARGRQLRCEYCSKIGATVGCCVSTCASNYHFMCARACRCSFQDDKKMFCQKHKKMLDGTQTVASDGFDVMRRVFVDFEGLSFRRKFLQGLEPENVHMMIGSMKIDSLGLLSDLSVSEGKIYPVGYQCSRLYWSTLDARRRCWYKCRILEYRPREGEEHFDTNEDPSDNKTIVHSPLSLPVVKHVEPALPSPPPDNSSHRSSPTPEPLTTATAPRSFSGARLKIPNFSPSRRPLGGSRPLPSPGSPSSSPLSHHILTVSDPEVTPLRRSRRPAPSCRVTRQSSARLSNDTTSPSPLPACPLTRHSSPDSDTPMQLLCGVTDMEVVSSLDGGLATGPLECGAQLVVGTEHPGDDSEGGSSSEEEPGEQYYELTRTVVSNEPFSPLLSSSASGHIQQLDGIHDSTDSEDGCQGPRRTFGNGKPPSHLPSDIVEFVLKNTGNNEAGAHLEQAQQPVSSSHAAPSSSSNTIQNGTFTAPLSNGTDCVAHQSSHGPPPLRDPPQLQRVCLPTTAIPQNLSHAPDSSAVANPETKVILVNKVGPMFLGMARNSTDPLSAGPTSIPLQEIPKVETTLHAQIIRAPAPRPIRAACKAPVHCLPLPQQATFASPNLNTLYVQATASSPLTPGQSWTLRGPLLSVLPMLNVVQNTGHLTLGAPALVTPTFTGIPQTCVLQGVAMNTGVSMNTGLLSVASAPIQPQSQPQLQLIQPAPPKVLPLPPLRMKRPCIAARNGSPIKKVKIESSDNPVLTNSAATNCSSACNVQVTTRPRQNRTKAPVVHEVLNLDSMKDESLNDGFHVDIAVDVKIEECQNETPLDSPCSEPNEGFIPTFEDFRFREEKENRIPRRSGPHLRFEIISEDGFYIQSESAEAAWKAVLEKVQEARGVGRLKGLSFSAGLNGARMLGIQHDAVLFLLEQLSGAERCRGYKFLFHPQEVEEDDLPINPSGCARSEYYVRKCTFDMFNFLASRHRTLPEIVPCGEEEEEEVQLKSTRRATSLDLPMAMRFRHLKRTSKEAVGVYRSEIHGRGLFCKRNIDAGEMVIEYSGNVIRAVLTDKREKFYDSKGIGCYMFRIDDFDVVDATMHGNAARFINHSCEPNCYSRVIHVEGQKHIVIFALRSIYRGEELTYDYKFPIEDANNKLPCNCGAKKCRRFLN